MRKLRRQMGGGLVSTAETASTTPQPEGNIIVRGEDGVPWELYENGYLLFKPIAGKDTLTNDHGKPSWKVNHGYKIKYIGFSGKVLAPTNSSYLFSPLNDHDTNYSFLPQFIDGSKIDTSKVSNMGAMFRGSNNLITLDVSEWDTSHVTIMANMFEDTRSLVMLDVSKWDTSNVVNMREMFYRSNKLTTLDVGKWDTGNVVNMNGTFGWMSGLTTLDVSNWNTRNVTTMQNLFGGTSQLTTLNISKWNTSNVTNMNWMFYRNAATTLDIGNWDTRNVTNMSDMFQNSAVTHLDIHNWTVSKATNMSFMFGDSAIITLDISNWNVSEVTNMHAIFYRTLKLKELKLGAHFVKEGIKSIDGIHDYGGQYTDKWHKVNDNEHPYTVSDWASAYAANSTEMAGTWVREEKSQDATLTFQGENFTPVRVKPSDTTLPTLPRPSQPKQNHKFLGWSKDGRNPITRDEVKPGETITLQPLWQPVSNIVTRTEAIPVTTTYRGDDKLDTGKRQETPGTPGEKRITTTYTSAPYTGELTNPVESTNIIRNMVPKVITIGTKPRVTKSNPVERTTRTNKDNTKPIGYRHVDTEGFDGYTETITHYDVDTATGNVTERTETRTVPPVERVVTEGALAYDLPTTGTADMTITLAGLAGTLVITKRKKSK